MVMKTPVIAVHLDFKGVMFKSAYLPKLVDDLADQSVNTVLLEYETVFPFKGIDASDDPETVLSMRDIKAFNVRAKARGIQVIPLVQCLGHLEYVLNKKRYRGLAIPHKFYDTIDPTNPKAVALVLNMLNQTLDVHPGITHIHLGMDEATSLTHLAKEQGRDVLELFIAHLETLLAVVESRGVKPIIWADMLQDFYKPGLFERFKDRVVLSPWEYGSLGDEPHTAARIGGGSRVAKAWRNEPHNPKAPGITSHSRYFEDMSPAAAAALSPYRVGERHVVRHFYLDFFVKEGFTCLPGSALRTSGNGPVLLPYQQLLKNQQSWAAAVKRVGTGAMGHIGTSWARARTFKPPNAMFDLTWPVIHEMARLMGANPAPFWPEIPGATVELLIAEIGRTREDWRIEAQILERMRGLLPKVKTHRYEFETLMLMVQTHAQIRAAEIVLNDIGPVLNAPRLVPEDFERRFAELDQARAQMTELEAKVMKHLAKRYHGLALEEWGRFVFGSVVARIAETRKACVKTKAKARKFWG